MVHLNCFYCSQMEWVVIFSDKISTASELYCDPLNIHIPTAYSSILNFPALLCRNTCTVLQVLQRQSVNTHTFTQTICLLYSLDRASGAYFIRVYTCIHVQYTHKRATYKPSSVSRTMRATKCEQCSKRMVKCAAPYNFNLCGVINSLIRCFLWHIAYLQPLCG